MQTRRRLAVAVAVLVSAASLAAAQQGAPKQNLDQCVMFNTLAEKHTAQAQEVQRVIAEQAKNLPAGDAQKYLNDRKKVSDSEWELAALARESYRKCMKDYLAGQPTKAPVATPSATAQPKAPATAKPAQQARPAQRSTPKTTQQSAPKTVQQPAQQQAPVVVEGGIGLLPMGIGILGVGRSMRGGQ